MVSIIIPNFNHSSYLNKRITSLLNQTYKDFELIILDDCSSDNSKEIIEQYRSNVRVTNIIYNEINSESTFKQWKKGIELAKGKYVWLAESDDYADNKFLEKVVPIIEKNDDVGLVFCNSQIVNANDQVIGKTYNWGKSLAGEKTNFFRGSEFCNDYLFLMNRIPNASAVLFKREPVLKNLEWIDTGLKNSGDWKLWINIALRSNVVWLKEELNYFRKHDHNVTSSLPLLKKEALFILKELVRDKEVRHKSKVYESLFFWSFNSACWTRDPKYNRHNLNLYLKGNFTLSSIFYLLLFLMKRLAISFIDYFKLKKYRQSKGIL